MNYIFKEADFNEVIELINEADESNAFLPDINEPDFTVSNFFKSYKGKENFFIFSLIDGEDIAGFISLLPTREGNALAIGPMYIKPGFRGKGLGRIQVEEVINWARCNKIKRLYTKTWGENYSSRRIFESLGFIMIKEIPRRRVNGYSTVKYMLDI